MRHVVSMLITLPRYFWVSASWMPELRITMLNCSPSTVIIITMYALRERRVHVTQEDFEMAVAKVLAKTDEKNESLKKLWT